MMARPLLLDYLVGRLPVLYLLNTDVQDFEMTDYAESRAEQDLEYLWSSPTGPLSNLMHAVWQRFGGILFLNRSLGPQAADMSS